MLIINMITGQLKVETIGVLAKDFVIQGEAFDTVPSDLFFGLLIGLMVVVFVKLLQISNSNAFHNNIITWLRTLCEQRAIIVMFYVIICKNDTTCVPSFKC